MGRVEHLPVSHFFSPCYVGGSCFLFGSIGYLLLINNFPALIRTPVLLAQLHCSLSEFCTPVKRRPPALDPCVSTDTRIHNICLQYAHPSCDGLHDGHIGLRPIDGVELRYVVYPTAFESRPTRCRRPSCLCHAQRRDGVQPSLSTSRVYTRRHIMTHS